MAGPAGLLVGGAVGSAPLAGGARRQPFPSLSYPLFSCLITDDANNIYTPHQRYVGLGGLALYGLGSYGLALLGAGIVFVVLRPWFTA